MIKLPWLVALGVLTLAANAQAYNDNPMSQKAIPQDSPLPSGHLFKPLLADPRWAHFSASYRDKIEYIGVGAHYHF